MPKPAIAERAAKPASAVTRKKGRRKAEAVLDKPTLQPGWLTSDDDEITLRRWRGRTEILSVKTTEPDQPYFGTFRAESASGGSYNVEICNLDGFANSCDCIDYRVNGLGTCKHIEGTLAAIARGRAKSFRAARSAGSPRVEIFLDRLNGAAPNIIWPAERSGRDYRAASDWLRPYLATDGTLAREPEWIEALLAAWDAAPPRVRAIARVSGHFTPWLARLRRERARVGARAAQHRQASAAALSARRRPAPRLWRTRASGRRDGTGQDHPGHCGLRAIGPAQGHRARARGLSRLAQGRMGGADRPLLRPPDSSRVRPENAAARRLSRARLLHHRQ